MMFVLELLTGVFEACVRVGTPFCPDFVGKILSRLDTYVLPSPYRRCGDLYVSIGGGMVL